MHFSVFILAFLLFFYHLKLLLTLNYNVFLFLKTLLLIILFPVAVVIIFAFLFLILIIIFFELNIALFLFLKAHFHLLLISLPFLLKSFKVLHVFLLLPITINLFTQLFSFNVFIFQSIAALINCFLHFLFVCLPHLYHNLLFI